MIQDRYYYSSLNETERRIYRGFYNGFLNWEKEIVVPRKGVDLKRITDIIQFINLDNPNLFYVKLFFYNYSYDDDTFTLLTDYFFDQNLTKKIEEKLLKIIAEIKGKITGKTEYEREISLHDMFIRNILYDEKMAGNEELMVKNNTIVGPLLYKNAVCEGIAKATKFLLNQLDILCIVVEGVSKKTGEDHAWNIVKIDGKPYHLDVTWNIGLSDQGFIAHDYLNLTTADIELDHEIHHTLPICRSNEYNFFTRQNLYVSSLSEFDKLFKKEILQKHKKSVSCRIDSPLLTVDDIVQRAEDLIERFPFSVECMEEKNETQKICNFLFK